VSPEMNGWLNLIYPGWPLVAGIGVLCVIGIVVVLVSIAMMMSSGANEQPDSDAHSGMLIDTPSSDTDVSPDDNLALKRKGDQ